MSEIWNGLVSCCNQRNILQSISRLIFDSTYAGGNERLHLCRDRSSVQQQYCISSSRAREACLYSIETSINLSNNNVICLAHFGSRAKSIEATWQSTMCRISSAPKRVSKSERHTWKWLCAHEFARFTRDEPSAFFPLGSSLRWSCLSSANKERMSVPVVTRCREYSNGTRG